MTHHTLYTSAHYAVIIHDSTRLSQQHTSHSTKCVCVCVVFTSRILQGCRRFPRHRSWPVQKRKLSPRMSKWTRRWKQPTRYSGFRRGGPSADLLLTRFALGFLPVGRCNPNALLGHEKIRRAHGEPRPACPTAGLTRQPRYGQLAFLP